MILLAGAETVERVMADNAPWADLFSKHDFFHKYRNYIQVVALTRDPQLQIKWWVLTRVSSLIIFSIIQLRRLTPRVR
jgi:poly(A) polymerase Pap1